MTNEETAELRRAHLLAALSEVRDVERRAIRELDTWREVLDCAQDLERRIRARLTDLGAVPEGEGTPSTPQAFLADLSGFAARQQRSAAPPFPTVKSGDFIRAADMVPVTYKPMPY